MGEFIQRVGYGNFLETDRSWSRIPDMISAPRDNPYVFYEEYDEDGDDEDRRGTGLLIRVNKTRTQAFALGGLRINGRRSL